MQTWPIGKDERIWGQASKDKHIPPPPPPPPPHPPPSILPCATTGNRSNDRFAVRARVEDEVEGRERTEEKRGEWMRVRRRRHHGKPHQSHIHHPIPSRNAQYTSLDVYIAFARLQGRWMSTHPRVPIVPQVSYDTARFTGRCVPVPATGTVSSGTGAVSELPTLGIPVRKPKWRSGLAGKTEYRAGWTRYR